MWNFAQVNEKLEKLLGFFFYWTSCRQTHRHSGDGGDEGVDQDRWRLTVVLWSRVWLWVGFVETEEALNMHRECVRVLKVICQQNGPCHDHQLEIKHIGSSVRIGEKIGQQENVKKKDRKVENIFPSQSKMMDASIMCKVSHLCEEREWGKRLRGREVEMEMEGDG